jgi:hypothetical protein
VQFSGSFSQADHQTVVIRVGVVAEGGGHLRVRTGNLQSRLRIQNARGSAEDKGILIHRRDQFMG